MKNLTTTTLVLLVAFVLAPLSAAHAILLHEETFPYDPGTDLETVNWDIRNAGGVWEAVAPGMSHPLVKTSGNAAERFSGDVEMRRFDNGLKPFFNSNSGTLYIAFMAEGRSKFMNLGGFNGSFTPEQITFGINGGGNLFLETREPGTSNDESGVAVSDSEQILYLTRVIFADGDDDVRVLARSADAPVAGFDWDAPSVLKHTTEDVSAEFNFMQWQVSASGRFDELRIATTLGEALGIPVPEPASLTLLGMGGLGLLRRRRQA